MQAQIRKVDIMKASQAIKRIVGRPEKILLKTNKNGYLSLLVQDSVIFEYIIPADKVVPGKALIYTALFDKLSLLRGEDILLKKEKNTIKVKSGTKLEIYTINEDKIITLPEQKTEKIVLHPKEAGSFRNMLKSSKFSRIDGEEDAYINIKNGKKLQLSLVDSVHACFYLYKKKSVGKDFEFTTNFNVLKAVSDLIETGVDFKKGKSFFIIKAPNFYCALPTIQKDNSVDAALSFLPNSCYKKGAITFSSNSFMEIWKGLSVITAGPEVLNFSIK